MKNVLMIISIVILNVYGTKRALLIAHNDGGKTVESLRYAHDDAKKVAHILEELGEFEKGNITVLLQPTKKNVLQELRKITVDRDSDDLTVVYYSGHADKRGLLLRNEVCEFSQIHSLIKSKKSVGVTVAIFDACHSGSMTAFKGGRAHVPFYLKNSRKNEGTVVIASAAANEPAQESEALRGSVFTHHWVNGLRGSADVSQDNNVTIQEAYQYAYQKTIEATALSGGIVQHPMYRFNMAGEGNVTLTSLKKRDGGIFFSKGLYGKFLLFDKNYTHSYGDFFKEEGKEIFISLSKGTYSAVWIQGNKTSVCTFTINKNVFEPREREFSGTVKTVGRIKGQHVETSVESVKRRDASGKPLKLYSGGYAIGAQYDVIQYDDYTYTFGTLSLYNSWYISKNFFGVFEIQSTVPDFHGKALAGVEFLVGKGKNNFSMSGSLGMVRINHDTPSFFKQLGPMIQGTLGISHKPNDRLRFVVRVPVSYSFVKRHYISTGVEFVNVFSGKFNKIQGLSPEEL